VDVVPLGVDLSLVLGGNQNLEKGVNPGGSRVPRILGWGGSQWWESQGAVGGSQNIILSYNEQEYDENTEHGSKRVLTFGENRIVCA